MLFTDPLLTANLYCAGHLDRALVDLMAPFASECLRGAGEGVWWIRNRRRGPHLKLRLHAAPARRSELAAELAGRAGRFFAELPGEPEARCGQEGVLGPAIDPEDEGEEEHPDRTLLWTTYRRTYVTLGHAAYAVHDRFNALFTNALAAGCAHVLDLLELDGEGQVAFSRRQQILLRLLLTGLGALPFTREEHRAYLTYHRDWLVRFTLNQRKVEHPAARTAELLAYFDSQAANMEPVVARLSGLAEEWGTPQEAEGAWEKGLRELWSWLAELCRDPAYAAIDPYAERPAQLPLFKVVHGTANALGLNLLEEALAHHLLLCALEMPVEVAG